MGREVRRVPKDWNHPKDESTGCYRPLLDGDWKSASANWKSGFLKWNPSEHDGVEYWEYSGRPPEREDYMFETPPEDRSWYQMYENTSEGTPKSPPFATPEEVARYCADNSVSSFADMTATYDQWLAVAYGGYAPSAVVTNGKLVSGVEFAGSND